MDNVKKVLQHGVNMFPFSVQGGWPWSNFECKGGEIVPFERSKGVNMIPFPKIWKCMTTLTKNHVNWTKQKSGPNLFYFRKYSKLKYVLLNVTWNKVLFEFCWNAVIHMRSKFMQLKKVLWASVECDVIVLNKLIRLNII